MRLDRCVLVACVMLSHICDSAAMPEPIRKNPIEDDLRANVKSLQRCIQKSVNRDGPTRGYKIDFRLVVDNGGHVTDTTVTGVKPPSLVDCLTKAVKSWKVTAGPGTHHFHVDVKIP